MTLTDKRFIVSRDASQAKRSALMSMKLLQIVTVSAGMVLAGAGFSVSYACGDGGCEPPPETSTKGNNGWGQEKKGKHDGTNAGSDNGGTADSKTTSTDR
jgi:hypothetical protein